MQRALGAEFSSLQWVVNAYTLMLGGLILVGGGLGDRLGRRLIFIIGIVVFTAASLACAVAPSVGFLIAARAVQGIGAALLVPQSLAIITACFPKSVRGRAIGTWAAASAVTTALGPALGGFLIDIDQLARRLLGQPAGRRCCPLADLALRPREPRPLAHRPARLDGRASPPSCRSAR